MSNVAYNYWTKVKLSCGHGQKIYSRKEVGQPANCRTCHTRVEVTKVVSRGRGAAN